MKMKLIAAADKNGGIGKDGKLIVYLADDMKHFRTTTMNSIVVMGRKTYESLPGREPLKGRRNIILSRNLELHSDDKFEVCHSVDELLYTLQDVEEDIYVIGGGTIYSLLLPYCTEACITEIDSTFDADTFIPLFSELKDWELVSESVKHKQNNITYSFVTYKRRI